MYDQSALEHIHALAVKVATYNQPHFERDIFDGDKSRYLDEKITINYYTDYRYSHISVSFTETKEVVLNVDAHDLPTDHPSLNATIYRPGKWEQYLANRAEELRPLYEQKLAQHEQAEQRRLAEFQRAKNQAFTAINDDHIFG